MFGKRKVGDLLMEAPMASTWQELCNQTSDEKGWREEVKKIKVTVHIRPKTTSENKSEETERGTRSQRAGKNEDSEDSDDERWKRGTERNKRTNKTVR